jgi:hypothetical protein
MIILTITSSIRTFQHNSSGSIPLTYVEPNINLHSVLGFIPLTSIEPDINSHSINMSNQLGCINY